jgi:transketolase
MGTVRDISGIKDWISKWQSFGWDVESIDGHDVNALYESFSHKNKKDTPQLIIANTVKGKGVSIMENNTTGWHYKMPSKREMKVFVKELSITEKELK